MNSNDKDFNIETFYVIIDNNIPTQISPEKINDKSKYVIIRKIHYGSGFFYTAKKLRFKYSRMSDIIGYN